MLVCPLGHHHDVFREREDSMSQSLLVQLCRLLYRMTPNIAEWATETSKRALKLSISRSGCLADASN